MHPEGVLRIHQAAVRESVGRQQEAELVVGAWLGGGEHRQQQGP